MADPAKTVVPVQEPAHSRVGGDLGLAGDIAPAVLPCGKARPLPSRAGDPEACQGGNPLRSSYSQPSSGSGRERQVAFTLIELLVVAAILGLVIAAIGACIGAGLRVWDTSKRVSQEQAAGMLAIALLDRDLGNSFPFYAIPFQGGQKELVFPCMVKETARNPSGIGEVRYTWDSSRRKLLREEKAFPGMTTVQPAAVETILPDVTAFAVEYGHMPKAGSSTFEWHSRWSDSTNHPHAVRITLNMGDASRTIHFGRTVWIPLGGEPYSGR